MLRAKRGRACFVLAAGAVSLFLFVWHGHSTASSGVLHVDVPVQPMRPDGARTPFKPGHDAQGTAPAPAAATTDTRITQPHSFQNPPALPMPPPEASMIAPPEPAMAPPTTIPTGYTPPRMTLIVLWSPQDREHNYLPNFFASVAASPTLDVLLVKFDKYALGADECARPRAAGASNVREVCIGMDEYWDLHVDYLCAHWGCDGQQRRKAREVIVARTSLDRVNSFYRPFRAEVFKKYMLPDVKYWAWADLDVVFGNFERVFPWDVVDQFDVIIAGWPTNWDHILLYMPGHLTAFRNDLDVAARFLQSPFLATFDAFVADDFLSEACEEAEYSHELFMRSGLTFLRFDAMVDSAHHLSSLDGVFAIENDGWAERTTPDEPADRALVHLAPQINAAIRAHVASASPQRATFTPAGCEAQVDVVNDGSRAPFLWFGAQYAVMYTSVLADKVDADGHGRAMRRYTLRRVRHGPVTERFEPEQAAVVSAVEPHEDWVYGTHNRPWLREALYTHFQTEKYRPWWSLPRDALKEGEVLYVDKENGARLWDADGVVLWDSPS